ncbi:MAG: methyltransferase domain-containing protein [Alphaproteobacteria bacterium]
MQGRAAARIHALGDCRFCGSPLSESFVDLGTTPLANSYIDAGDAGHSERCFPLHAFVCDACFLVQLPAHESPEEIFSDYAYFSSYSDSWLDHARAYCTAMVERFDIDENARVVEVASNDGYLLQFFKERGVSVLGIEPAANVAEVAESKGIPTLVRFFGVRSAKCLAERGKQADLLIANNVLAHVPDINDFVAGLRLALRPSGVLTIEFPHLLNLLAETQFDTIYHEHFSYLSLTTTERILKAHGLSVFDVEELPTHGGSLRIFACREDSGRTVTTNPARIRAAEKKAGLRRIDTYRRFDAKAQAVRRDLRDFLAGVKKAGKTIAGYGAPAKGNTLLNYCGIGPDLLPYTVDVSPHKQGRLLPGSRIPVLDPSAIAERQPDYVLILPWNIREEIVEKMKVIRKWGGRFVVPIPEIKVLP